MAAIGNIVPAVFTPVLAKHSKWGKETFVGHKSAEAVTVKVEGLSSLLFCHSVETYTRSNLA